MSSRGRRQVGGGALDAPFVGALADPYKSIGLFSFDSTQ